MLANFIGNWIDIFCCRRRRRIMKLGEIKEIDIYIRNVFKTLIHVHVGVVWGPSWLNWHPKRCGESVPFCTTLLSPTFIDHHRFYYYHSSSSTLNRAPLPDHGRLMKRFLTLRNWIDHRQLISPSLFGIGVGVRFGNAVNFWCGPFKSIVLGQQRERQKGS